MASFFAKVYILSPAPDLLFTFETGLTYSTLPTMIRSRAHNILISPSHHRPAGIALLPHQLIQSKMVGELTLFTSRLTLPGQPVEPNVPPRFTLREDRMPGVTESWKKWYEAREVDEWMQTVGGVLESGWNDQ